MAKIPELPKIVITVKGDVSRPNGGKYLRLRHPELTLGYPSGTTSEAFVYDMIVRDALDAAVVAAHFPSERGTMVVLRSAVRPPVGLRHVAPSYDASMWELVAGLVEVGEDPKVCAVRELDEEIGAKVSLEAMKELGGPTFPSPGVIGERHLYFHVEIDPSKMGKPSEDGSALESQARIVFVPLADALAWCADGSIVDAKTELALRRLRDVL